MALLGEGDHVLDVAVDADVGADEARRAAALVDRGHRRLARGIETSATTTVAPSAASRSTIVQPAPAAPPVTIATRPCRSIEA